jgi:hypothetical protein
MKNHKFTTINLFPIFGMLLFLVFTISSCKDDDRIVEEPPTDLDFELITTVEAHFKNMATNEVQTFIFDDPDGIGGNPPIQLDTVFLKTNSEYELTFTFLDKSNPDDIIDVTPDIIATADQHLMCFESDVESISITILDRDKNDLPLGLKSKLETKAVSTGYLTTTLRHQTRGKNGDCNIGDTDVEVQYPLVILY